MAKKSSTQQFVPIQEIRDGVLILKDGKMCTVLLASSVNFSLKSSVEQQAILAQFQSFLNMIDFSVQFYIQSRRMDIRPYLDMLATREEHQYNDLLRIQLREYIEFIRAFTSEVDIMTKNFFVVIPYTPAAVDVSGIAEILSTKKETDPIRFQEDKSQLEQRVTVVEQGLARVGVRTVSLGTDELVELFYHIYNPDETNKAPKR